MSIYQAIAYVGQLWIQMHEGKWVPEYISGTGDNRDRKNLINKAMMMLFLCF